MNEEYNVTDNTSVDEVSEPLPVIESISEDVSTDNGSNITVVINNPSNAVNDSELETKDSNEAIAEEPQEMILQSVTVSNERISASDTNGLKSVLLSVIGDYETVVTDYEYRTGSSSYVSHSIDVQPDYCWIASCVVFLVCLYSMFRLYGLVFGRGRR